MIKLSISQDIRDIFGNIQVGILTGKVSNSAHHELLWKKIKIESNHLKSRHNFESIREIPAIKSGKQAYRLLGKDPNRYRVSAEAMIRRIVKGNSLYHIHTLVDILNLSSIKSGVTIGGFDRDRIEGDLLLDIGRNDEEFDAIGRGLINIDRLPVYRDQISAIGSPTSDCTRTMLTLETSYFLMIITDFFGEGFIESVMADLKLNLAVYAGGDTFSEKIIK